MKNTQQILAMHAMASLALKEASRTIQTTAKNALFDLDIGLGRVIGSVKQLAENGTRTYRQLYQALANNERLALEWDAQQQRTIDLARKNWELENSFKAIGYYAEHLDDCCSRAGRDEKCSCGLATLWEMTHGIR